MEVMEIDGEFLHDDCETGVHYKPVPVYRVTVTPRFGNRLVITVWATKTGRTKIMYAAKFGTSERSNAFRYASNLGAVIRSANYRARRYAAAYRKPRGITPIKEVTV